jgi:hypothetical protein
MPPFIVPVIQAVVAAFTIDRLREASRRFVARPAPPTFAQGGGASRPPASPPARTYPIARQPIAPFDRRAR